MAEAFIAVGRAGEPFVEVDGTAASTTSDEADDFVGVRILRYTTPDFVRWSAAVVVVSLPDGWLPGHPKARPGLGDGLRWTAKSIARSDSGEVMRSPLKRTADVSASVLVCQSCASSSANRAHPRSLARSLARSLSVFICASTPPPADDPTPLAVSTFMYCADVSIPPPPSNTRGLRST